MVSFIFGGDTGETPETLAQKRRVALALLQQDGAPRNVGEGLAAIGKALSGRFALNYLDKSEKDGRDKASTAFDSLFSSGGSGGAGSGLPTSEVSAELSGASPAPGNAPSYRDAIASIESAGSGDYSAVGPTNPKLGRPLGRYQVMEANIGPWSREALGREVTADEFLANPQIQDAIFDHRFGGYVKQFGPEGAAQAWFAGPGGVGKVDRKDVLGTSVGEYGSKLRNALGPQVASAQPMTATDAINTQAAPSGYVDPMVTKVAPQPGQQVAQALTAPPAQAAPPLPAPIDVATPPVPPQAMQPQQAAQAMPASQPVADQASGPSLQQLMQAASNPWLNDGQRSVVQALLQQKMQESDPVRKLQMQKLQKEIAASSAGDVKIAGDRAFRIMPDGSVQDVTPGAAQPGRFRFSGSSVEAQALNGLMDSGQLTSEQAQQLGAGKTITGPNGEILFMTPQGVFGQPATGGPAEPISAPPAGGVDIFGDSSGSQAEAPRKNGNIQLTEPKVTVDEKKAMTFADRMATSGSVIDQLGDVGTEMGQALLSQVPFGVGNKLVSEDFQKLDQARRDFINAQLRRESGAVISPEEFDNANKQYFPQPGDGPKVIAQKERNRRIAIEGMIRDSGPTYSPPNIKPPSGQSRKPTVVDGYTIEEVDE